MQRLLIINRGEIAKRIASAASDLGLEIHLIYEAGDAHHLRSDAKCHLVDDYHDPIAILTLAKNNNIHFIHPGYGYLSENGVFAKQVVAENIVWVGPTGTVIEMFGDKFSTKSLARKLDIPTLKSSKNVDDLKDWQGPIMVKASMGGGGRAMQVANSFAACKDVINRVSSEANSIFKDGQLFFEPYISSARHIEIQVLTDHFGQLRIIGDRDCSMQRRFQKIIEEAPARGLSDKLRMSMYQDAAKIAKHSGLTSCATIEFLLDATTQQYWLMEVNPRIQVEHGVTELVSGIDLVKWQLKIAMGYKIDFAQSDIKANGHAIQARVYTEDASQKFKPTFGSLWVSKMKPMKDVFWHTSIETGQLISQKYDPMIMKVLAKGNDFKSAQKKLIDSLENWHMAGILSNRRWLISALKTIDCDTYVDTQWAINHKLKTMDEKIYTYAAIVTTILNHKYFSDMHNLDLAPNWNISGNFYQSDTYCINNKRVKINYLWVDKNTIELDSKIVVSTCKHIDDEISLSIGDHHIDFRVSLEPNHTWIVSCLGHNLTIRQISDTHTDQSIKKTQNTLVSPMPGTMVSCKVTIGDEVKKGHVLAVIEAMKMHFEIKAAYDLKIIALNYEEGQHIPMGKALFECEAMNYEILES